MPDNDSNYPPQSGRGFPPDNKDGTPGLIGPDEYARWDRIQRASRQPRTVLSGNIADMQRLGAEVANSSSATVNSALAAPPGVDPKNENVLTPAQAEALDGQWTRETERTGLLGPPPAHVPAENTEPDSIDPGSQSPVQVPKGDQAKLASSSPRPAPKASNG